VLIFQTVCLPRAQAQRLAEEVEQKRRDAEHARQELQNLLDKERAAGGWQGKGGERKRTGLGAQGEGGVMRRRVGWGRHDWCTIV